MVNGSQSRALLAAISALVVAASGQLRAAEPVSADLDQPPQSVTPEPLLAEAEYRSVTSPCPINGSASAASCLFGSIQ